MRGQYDGEDEDRATGSVTAGGRDLDDEELGSDDDDEEEARGAALEETENMVLTQFEKVKLTCPQRNSMYMLSFLLNPM